VVVILCNSCWEKTTKRAKIYINNWVNMFFY
jgi:hypothetical protein